jgi:hypothetical protein
MLNLNSKNFYLLARHSLGKSFEGSYSSWRDFPFCNKHKFSYQLLLVQEGLLRKINHLNPAKSYSYEEKNYMVQALSINRLLK